MKRLMAITGLLVLIGVAVFATGETEGETSAVTTSGAAVENAGKIESYATPAAYEKATGKKMKPK